MYISGHYIYGVCHPAQGKMYLPEIIKNKVYHGKMFPIAIVVDCKYDENHVLQYENDSEFRDSDCKHEHTYYAHIFDGDCVEYKDEYFDDQKKKWHQAVLTIYNHGKDVTRLRMSRRKNPRFYI